MFFSYYNLKIQDEVVNFLIKEALPLNKAESPHLKRLIDGMLYVILLIK